ncbi:CD82 antigen-like [Halichondria panicea]|uniref:CD82 antigen-like n=1 Tax=Halichondria panicea TaxID=6063 RepID=UPI00312B6D9F
MAETGFCARVVQIAFVLINIFFVLLGVGLIAGGSYLVASGSSLAVFAGSIAIGLSVVIILVGIVVFFVAAIGILGGIFRHKLLLGIYLVALVLIIVAEVGVAVAGIIKRGELEGVISVNVGTVLDNYANHNKTDLSAINFVQWTFKCCGWNNSNDYVVRDAPIPMSCDCTNNVTGTCEPLNSNRTIWSIGCKSGVSSAFRTYLAVIIALAILVALIEIMAVLLSLCLCCSGKKDNYETV